MNLFDPKLEIRAYVTVNGALAFGAATPEGTIKLEEVFPEGSWRDDDDGRPLFIVGYIEEGHAVVMEPCLCGAPGDDLTHGCMVSADGPPYDAATATGMYDHDDVN